LTSSSKVLRVLGPNLTDAIIHHLLGKELITDEGIIVRSWEVMSKAAGRINRK